MGTSQHGQTDITKSQAVDYVTSGVKAALGAVPFAGSLLAEIAGSIIPNQRIDRISRFAVELNQRIAAIEESAIRKELKDDQFTELIEEALRQAGRATSQERCSYLASLVANSLSPDAIRHVESNHIIKLLGELNDLEVLWLRSFHRTHTDADEQFHDLHKELLEEKIARIRCSTRELNDHALQESYKDHLIRLGLLRRNVARNRDGNPEFDSFSGDFRTSSLETSALGELLLESIGMIRRIP